MPRLNSGYTNEDDDDEVGCSISFQHTNIFTHLYKIICQYKPSLVSVSCAECGVLAGICVFLRFFNATRLNSVPCLNSTTKQNKCKHKVYVIRPICQFSIAYNTHKYWQCPVLFSISWHVPSVCLYLGSWVSCQWQNWCWTPTPTMQHSLQNLSQWITTHSHHGIWSV